MRDSVIAFLQGNNDIMSDDILVIGFALVIEVMDGDGERHAVTLTSDASGKKLPHYIVNGLADFLREADDFDQVRDGEDD